jgi:ribonuclease PH
MQTDVIGTQGGANFVSEKKIKDISLNLQTELQKIMSSCILTDLYPSTTIAFQFTVIEMDSDLLQSMINCASLALYKSGISCRCLPISITLFLKPIDKRSSKAPTEWI